jgi:hypothetical protein
MTNFSTSSKRNSVTILFLLLGLIFTTFAQEYPQDYFKFPIKPGQQGYLAGTFGELRSNHFHSGIDIKTGGREGLNVYAAADGYVSRIKIQVHGYGKAIYIDHPNGYTTVYAHLQHYNPYIDSIIRAIQYKNKSFTVNYFPPKGSIKIKKGEVIAKSGNTGGSMGPHLHFEIRNRKQEPINPLLFGFKEIKDNVRPTISNLAVTPLTINSRVNGEFNETVFQTKLIENGTYQLASNDTIFVKGAFHLNLAAIDKLNGVPNKNGIYTLQVAVDDTIYYKLNVDKFSFAHTRMINEHINYRLYKSIGKRYYKIYYNNKNKLGFYDSFTDKGILNFNDFKAHHIKVICADAYGNQSTLKFIVKNTNDAFTSSNNNKTNELSCSIINNTMCISVPINTEAPVTSHSVQHEQAVFPAYHQDQSTIYLLDLARELPQYIAQDSVLLDFPYLQQVVTNNGYTFNYKKLKINFPKNAIYSTMYLTVKDDSSTVIIGDVNIPLYKNITVKNTEFKKEHDPYLGVYSVDFRGRFDYENCWWENDGLVFKTRSLGEFRYLHDSIPPTIKTVQISSKQVVLKIEDKLSGIGQITVTLNDKWLLMNYDYKTGKIWSETKNKNQVLKGDLSVKITDNQGNISTFAKKLL